MDVTARVPVPVCLLILSLCLVPYLPHRRTLRAPRSRGPVHGVVGRQVGVLAYRSEGVRVGQRGPVVRVGHAGRRECMRIGGSAYGSVGMRAENDCGRQTSPV